MLQLLIFTFKKPVFKLKNEDSAGEESMGIFHGELKDPQVQDAKTARIVPRLQILFILILLCQLSILERIILWIFYLIPVPFV